MKKFILFLSILLMSNQITNCGFISWLQKNDNTITAGAVGSITALATLFAANKISNKDILKRLDLDFRTINPDFEKWQNQNTEFGLLTILTTMLHDLNRPHKYNLTNKDLCLYGSLNLIKLALSGYAGYKAYKLTKQYLESNKAKQQ